MTESKPLFILISESSRFEHSSRLLPPSLFNNLRLHHGCKFSYHRPTCSKYATSSVLAWSLPCDAVIPQKNACFDLLTCSMMIWQWGKPLEFSSECQASFAVIVCNSNKIKKKQRQDKMCHKRALATGERFKYSVLFNLNGDRGRREFVSPRFSTSVSGVKLNFRSSSYKWVL